jgi:hypothetical protein
MPELTVEQAKRRIGHVVRVFRDRGGTHYQPAKILNVNERTRAIQIRPNGHGEQEIWVPLRQARRWLSKDKEAGIFDPEDIKTPPSVDVLLTSVAVKSNAVPADLARWDMKLPRAAIVDHSASPVPPPQERPQDAPDERTEAQRVGDGSSDVPDVQTPQNERHAFPIDHVLYDLDTLDVWAGTAWGFLPQRQEARWKRMTRQDSRRLATMLAKPGLKGEGRRLAADPLSDVLELMTSPPVVQSRDVTPGREPEPSPTATIILPEPAPIVTPPAPSAAGNISDLLSELAAAERKMRELESARDAIRDKLRAIKSQLEQAGI